MPKDIPIPKAAKQSQKSIPNFTTVLLKDKNNRKYIKSGHIPEDVLKQVLANLSDNIDWDHVTDGQNCLFIDVPSGKKSGQVIRYWSILTKCGLETQNLHEQEFYTLDDLAQAVNSLTGNRPMPPPRAPSTQPKPSTQPRKRRQTSTKRKPNRIHVILPATFDYILTHLKERYAEMFFGEDEAEVNRCLKDLEKEYSETQLEQILSKSVLEALKNSAHVEKCGAASPLLLLYRADKKRQKMIKHELEVKFLSENFSDPVIDALKGYIIGVKDAYEEAYEELKDKKQSIDALYDQGLYVKQDSIDAIISKIHESFDEFDVTAEERNHYDYYCEALYQITVAKDLIKEAIIDKGVPSAWRRIAAAANSIEHNKFAQEHLVGRKLDYVQAAAKLTIEALKIKPHARPKGNYIRKTMAGLYALGETVNISHKGKVVQPNLTRSAYAASAAIQVATRYNTYKKIFLNALGDDDWKEINLHRLVDRLTPSDRKNFKRLDNENVEVKDNYVAQIADVFFRVHEELES